MCKDIFEGSKQYMRVYFMELPHQSNFPQSLIILYGSKAKSSNIEIAQIRVNISIQLDLNKMDFDI